MKLKLWSFIYATLNRLYVYTFLICFQLLMEIKSPIVIIWINYSYVGFLDLHSSARVGNANRGFQVSGVKHT